MTYFLTTSEIEFLIIHIIKRRNTRTVRYWLILNERKSTEWSNLNNWIRRYKKRGGGGRRRRRKIDK